MGRASLAADLDRRRAWRVVLLLVLLGLTLRVWYASEALWAGRFIDERYSLLNIRSIVTTGTLKPINPYYPYPFFNAPPAALVATSEALHRWLGDERFRTMIDGEFGPATYFLCRFVQSLYGALGLLLTFLVGRRLFSAEVGLIGTVALAFTPWHIHASGYFKPDAQLTAMILLALWLSVRAIERPTLRNHILAGIAIALAMSSKLPGGVVAVPLVVGVLVTGWRQVRRLALLVVSGVTSAVTFVALNPYWTSYPTWLAGLERDYAMRAAREGMTRLQVPRSVAELITDGYVLGPVLGTASLLAFTVWIAGLLRPGARPREQQAQRWMFAVFPLAYTAAYAWKTAYFKPNNFLPIVPFACLLAAWAMVGAWRWVAAHVPVLRRRVGTSVGVFVLGLMLVPSGFLYAYRSVTPTTTDAALGFLRQKLRPPSGRVVFVERVPTRRPGWDGARRFGGGRSVVEAVDRLDRIPSVRLDLADGEIFPQRRLAGEAERFYRERMARVPEERVQVFRSRTFLLRGPATVALKHPFRRETKPVWLPVRNCRPRRRCFTAELPADLESTPLITLVVRIGFARGASIEGVDSLRVGNRDLPILTATHFVTGATFVTERFPPPELGAEVRFQTQQRLVRKRQIAIELHRWRLPNRDSEPG